MRDEYVQRCVQGSLQDICKSIRNFAQRKAEDACEYFSSFSNTATDANATRDSIPYHRKTRHSVDNKEHNTK